MGERNASIFRSIAMDARTPGAAAGRAEELSFAGKLALVVAAIALAIVLYRLAIVFLLIAAAIVVAVIIHLLADPLRRRFRLGRKLSVFTAITLLLTLLGVSSFFFGREIVSQANMLIDRLPDSVDEILARLGDGPLGPVIERIEQIDADPAALFRQVRGAIEGALTTLVYLVIILTTGVIFAIYTRSYRDGALLLLPPRHRERVGAATDLCGRALKGWLVGQLISMLVIGVLTSVGLMLIGLPSWLALGVIAGVAQFVPILGPIVSSIPGLIVAASMDFSMFLKALLVYVGVQQLEANIITPFVMRKVASLPMALTILSIIAFAALFGVPGAILAAPITVAVYVLVQKLYIRDTLGDEITIIGERNGERTPRPAPALPERAGRPTPARR